jgi:hypothetical protein
VVSGKPLKRVAEETRETITLSVLRGSPSGCASFTRGP